MLTWPQALYLGTKVAAHQDPYLSIWRLGWIAHALRGDPRHFFDANIFYPNARTLAYSDATLLEGALAAPWFWADVNPLLVYNILLLAGIASSGIGMFVLVRYLTGNADAALVSATIFTLVPYRVEHFMHLELQWTAWMPLTLWAVHRVFDEGSIRTGLLVGALVWLQMMSSVYYGAFLGCMVVTVALLLSISQPGKAARAVGPFCAGALLLAPLAAAYAWPYVANARVLGPRAPGEVSDFSAQAASYLAAPEQNWLWGWTAFQFRGNELHLFPGLIPILLAAVALGSGRRRLVWIYLATCAAAVELSLGLNGTVYNWLYDRVWALQGFRAPSRFAILACCCLAVLAGIGFETLQRLVRSGGNLSADCSAEAPSAQAEGRSTKVGRSALLVGVLVLIGIECGSAPMRLMDVPTQVPDVYKFLRTARQSVVVELPIVDWDFDPQYMFWSIFHWQPLVNGYSGYVPSGYTRTLARMRTFPDENAIARLKDLNVRYILVHETFYQTDDRTSLMMQLARRSDMVWAGKYRDWIGSTEVFELTRGRQP
jgi:hypothetical protein